MRDLDAGRLGTPPGVVAQAGGVGGVVEVGEPGPALGRRRLQQHDGHLDAAATGVGDRDRVRLDQGEGARAPRDVEAHRLVAQRQARVDGVLPRPRGEHGVLGRLELLEAHDVDRVVAQDRDGHVHPGGAVRVEGRLVAAGAGVGVAEHVEGGDAELHGGAAALELLGHPLGQSALRRAEAAYGPLERGRTRRLRLAAGPVVASSVRALAGLPPASPPASLPVSPESAPGCVCASCVAAGGSPAVVGHRPGRRPGHPGDQHHDQHRGKQPHPRHPEVADALGKLPVIHGHLLREVSRKPIRSVVAAYQPSAHRPEGVRPPAP